MRRLSTLLIASLLSLTACDMAYEDGAPDLGSTEEAITGTNGISVNGMGTNGVLVNGFSLNGLKPNGVNLNGVNLNGVNLNGVNLNGATFNGVNLNGVNLNGLGTNGVNLNGVNLNGVAFNGIAFNSLYFNGVNLNGVNLNGVNLNGVNLNGVNLNSAQQDTVRKALYHLVGCALPSGQSVTISGTTYYGARGFAPEWRTGPLTDTNNGRVRACVESATTVGMVIEDFDVTPNAQEKARLDKVFKYMVECALAQGDSVTVTNFGGGSKTYYGAFGLATGWKTSTPSTTDLRKVSACLAARANANEQTVMISLRGAGISSTDVERAAYPWHEGAFWADLFSDEPYMKTCSVNGGISGRVCSGGGCGFDYQGACASVCDSQDPTDHHYYGCGSTDDQLVVNTFMNLSSDVSFGDHHSCLKQPDGKIWCWGDNGEGQIGIGTTSSVITTPTRPAISETFAQVVTGYHTTCARTVDGDLYCWGFNNYGQVGIGSTASAIPTASFVMSDVAQADVGHHVTCGIKTDGTLWCWGLNDYYQLGMSSPSYSRTPLKVTALGTGVVKVSSGWNSANHACAVKGDGTLWCWGRNHHAQLGLGTVTTRELPQRVSGLSNITDVCTGQAHSCARKSNGTVYCWGDNGHGQLGDGTWTDRKSPVSSISGVAVGGLSCGDFFTCVARTDGRAYCWGEGATGRLGNNSTGKQNNEVAVLQGSSAITNVVSVRAGLQHACAIKSDDSIWCWGLNDKYQLGDGTTTTRLSAVRSNFARDLPSCGNGICEATEGTGTCAADCCSYDGQKRACGGTDVGACEPQVQICHSGEWGTCGGGVGPTAETCNGEDDDCDGATDEDLVQACGSDVGVCESGTQTCTAGSWGTCDGEVTGSSETCGDGLDNDCDGSVDEGCCTAEVCGDGIDNDCDGSVDEGCAAASCDGYCGGASPGGCYCDDLCTTYGDCCGDYDAVCTGAGGASADACEDLVCSYSPSCCGSGLSGSWTVACANLASYFETHPWYGDECVGVSALPPETPSGLTPDGYATAPYGSISWDPDAAATSHMVVLYRWSGAWYYVGTYARTENRMLLPSSVTGYFAFQVRSANSVAISDYSNWAYGQR